MSEKVQILLVMTLVFWGIGGFLIAVGVNDWDWFFNSRKYRLWVKLFGRKGMRIVVGLLGICLLLVPAYLYIFKW